MKYILQTKKRFKLMAAKNWLYKPVFVIIGLVSLLWFLLRVIPKPSRAAYPCMQTAFPIASSFVVWFVGSIGSIALFKQLPVALNKRKYFKIAGFALSGLLLFLIATTFNNDTVLFAGSFNNNNTAQVAVNKEYGNTIDQLKTKVSVVKSGKALASEIQYPEILSMVREAVRLAGGFEQLITDGKTVMLKPNLVNDYPNRSIEVNGATTDYRVVQAVVDLVRELKKKGKIIIAEGSGGDVASKTIMTRLKYMDITGVNYIMGFEASSGNYRDFASDSLVAVNLPDALSKYPDDLKPNRTRAIFYNKRYFKADVLISIPVLKNHSTAGITGGVKNVAIGCSPANIYADKTNARPFLRSAVIPHDVPTLSKWMHDYYIGRPVDFVIIDGLQGGSNGPGVGSNSLTTIKKSQQNMRLILAGKDAVATDAVAGLIMGHDPQKAAYLVDIHNSGYGIVDPALIDVVGVKVHTVRKAFGFDAVNTVVTTPFNKFASTDYRVTGTISNNTLNMSVSNPDDLARVQVTVDNQKVNKYVVGGFNSISLSLEGINVTQGVVDVYFEDRYLNPLSKQFKAQITTSAADQNNHTSLSVFPNPADKEVTILLPNSSAGLYTIQIMDLNGRVIQSIQHNNTFGHFEHVINLEKLNSGYYVIRLLCPNKTALQQKILKR